MHFKSQWSTDGDESLLDEDPINLTEVHNGAAGGVVGGENAIEEVPF